MEFDSLLRVHHWSIIVLHQVPLTEIHSTSFVQKSYSFIKKELGMATAVVALNDLRVQKKVNMATKAEHGISVPQKS